MLNTVKSQIGGILMTKPRSMIHIAITLLMGILTLPVSAQSEAREVVAYFPEWAVRLQNYWVKHIAESPSATELTVINYSFVIPGPDATGDVVCQLDDPDAAYLMAYDGDMAVDGNADTAEQALRGHFNQLRKLKARPEFTDIKILIAIGGWTGSTWFSDAAATPQSRATFVQSCIDMFIHGNLPEVDGWGGTGSAAGIFDGFDIDWEYPITGGDSGVHHNSNDDVNLTALLAEFRAQLDTFGTGLLLTIATPASAFRGDNYQINEDKAYVDWFNLMTYDFHGAWENKTGHLTNPLRSPDDPSSDAFKMSMDDTVRLYTQTYGVDMDQLVPGAAFFGRGWKNVSPTNNGLYQSGREAPGVYEGGYNYYKDLEPLLDQGYSMFWDSHALASWIYSPSEGIFWSLDEPQSLALKRRYVDAYNMKGIMTWEITGDDKDGTLLSALVTGNPSSPYSSPPDIQLDENLLITIDQPVDCAISLEGFNQVINASATAPAGEEIQQIEFFGDNQSLGFDDRPPWSWAWFNLPRGVHELTAEVTLRGGGWNASLPVNIDVRAEGPELGLWQTGVSYQSGDEVFYQGCIYSAKRNHFGSRVRTPTSGRYWSLLTCSGDCGGGSGGNQPPTVSITSPANNAQFDEGADIEISVTANDPDGTVENIGFYPDSLIPCSLVKETDTDNYACTWSGAPAGTHQLAVIAVDDQADTGQSSINIVVLGAGGCTQTPWNEAVAYNKGDSVSHNDIKWRAKKPSKGVEPGTSPSKWTNLGPCVD
jgi:GH18 family chitinase